MTEEQLATRLEFLDDLRESGVTNMFSAPVYLMDSYGDTRKTAGAVTNIWMKTFDGETTPEDRAGRVFTAEDRSNRAFGLFSDGTLA